MTRRYKIGDGVYAVYERDSQGSLPRVTIRRGGVIVAVWRGSSLGPRNYECDPIDCDLAYWQSLAGVPDDPAARRRSLAAHRRADARWWPEWPEVQP